MKKHDIFKKIGLGLAISALAACQASAIVAYSNQGVVANESSTGGNGPYALGNDFTVNQAISVYAIGAFDNGGPMAASVSVAIYNVTLNAIVAGTTVTLLQGTQGNSQLNGSAFINITPVTLLAGDVYSIVAANYGQGGAPYWWNHSPVGTTPTFNDGGGLITMGGGRYSPGTTLTLPGTLVGETPGIPTYGAGTFEFTALTPVPEVETFAIASVSMLGLVFIGRNLVPRRRF